MNWWSFDEVLWIFGNFFSTFSEIVSRNLQSSWIVSGKYYYIKIAKIRYRSAIHRFMWNSVEHRESLRDARPSQGPTWLGFTSLEGLISAHRSKQATRRSARFKLLQERCPPFSRFGMVRLHEFDWTHQCLTTSVFSLRSSRLANVRNEARKSTIMQNF